MENETFMHFIITLASCYCMVDYSDTISLICASCALCRRFYATFYITIYLA